MVESEEIRGNRKYKIGKFYCILTNKTYRSLSGIRNGIRKYDLTVKEYYDKYYKSDIEGICEICNGDCSFDNLIVGYKKFCSDSCFNKNPEKRNKISNRFKNNPEKYIKYRENLRNSLNSRSPEKVKEISENYRKGALKVSTEERQRIGKLGSDKLQELCNLDPTKRPLMILKALKTKETNNSFSNGLSGKVKQISYNGIEFICQGYEDIVIKYLIDNKIEFYNRKLCPVISIESNRSKKYMPDLYLPKYNLLIDVKSEYTMPISDKKIKYYLERQNASFNQNYNFFIFAIHGKTIKKSRVLSDSDKICFENLLTMLISSQAIINGRFNDYPVIRSTLQVIGSGSSGKPTSIVGL